MVKVKWKYLTVHISPGFDFSDLNKFGAEGWELVVTFREGVKLILIFKQPVNFKDQSLKN